MHVHGSLLDRMDHQRICVEFIEHSSGTGAGDERKTLSPYR